MTTVESRAKRALLPSRAMLVACLSAAVLTIIGSETETAALEWTGKPLVTLSLMAYVTIRRAMSRPDAIAALLLGGLAFSLAGDVTLQFASNETLLAGIALFAGTHVCYVLALTRVGDPANRVGVAGYLPYVAVWLAINVALFHQLSGLLSIAVSCYSGLILTMSFLAWRCGLLAGAGGVFFVVSDGLLAARDLANLNIGYDGLVMATYASAQALIAMGVMRKHVQLRTTPDISPPKE